MPLVACADTRLALLDALLQVEEMARLDGETAIGYIESKEGTLHLAPRSTDQHLFDEHSRVVVIAGLD